MNSAVSATICRIWAKCFSMYVGIVYAWNALRTTQRIMILRSWYVISARGYVIRKVYITTYLSISQMWNLKLLQETTALLPRKRINITLITKESIFLKRRWKEITGVESVILWKMTGNINLVNINWRINPLMELVGCWIRVIIVIWTRFCNVYFIHQVFQMLLRTTHGNLI